MKKVLSVFLCFVIVFSTLSVIVSASEKCDCPYTPVILVVGQGEDLYLDCNTENEKLIPDVKSSIVKIIPKFVLGIVLQAIYGDYDALGKLMKSMCKDVIEEISCDKDGNSKYNVGVHTKEYDPQGRHIALEYGECNPMTLIPCDGKFLYDWRLDPLYNADLLKEYVESVKEKTGHDKIIIMAHSEGNNVLCSYLYKYGHEDFEKVMFLSPAYQGLSILGSLFSGEYTLGNKSEALVTFMDTFLGNSFSDNLIKSAVGFAKKCGLADLVLHDVQKLLDNVYEQEIYDYIMDSIGTMPGMWSFCPDEYYERAKHRAFDGKEGYENLIEKIDYYHYNVQNNVPSIIQSLLDDGVIVYIVSGYGVSSIPVSNTDPQQSDLVIDTKYMSIGASCSEIGKTFESNYTQQIDDGHTHLSPDMMIDASTCAFPEITWFIRGKLHDDNPNAFCQFLWELAYTKQQQNVFTLDGYPQFLKYENDNFLPVTAEDKISETIVLGNLFKNFFEIIKR